MSWLIETPFETWSAGERAEYRSFNSGLNREDLAEVSQLDELEFRRNTCYKAIERREELGLSWTEYFEFQEAGEFWAAECDKRKEENAMKQDPGEIRLKTVYRVCAPEDQAMDAKNLTYEALIDKYNHMRAMAFRLERTKEVAKLWVDWADVLENEIQNRLAKAISDEIKADAQTITVRLPVKSTIPEALPHEPVPNPRHR
jgi:hypothetical protein